LKYLSKFVSRIVHGVITAPSRLTFGQGPAAGVERCAKVRFATG